MLLAGATAALTLLFAWGHPVRAPGPRPTLQSLRAAVAIYCADRRKDVACTHLLPALRRYGWPKRSAWFEADAKNRLPWVELGDPDPDWPEYDWTIDYEMSSAGVRPRVERIDCLFTP